MTTLAEIYKSAKDFYDNHIDCYGEPWNKDTKLSEIIVCGRHGQWITFKNLVRSHRIQICDNLLSCSNISMANKMTSIILDIYKKIIDFINIHRADTTEDNVYHTSREGIALELRNELTETIDFIYKTVSDIASTTTDCNSKNKTCAIDRVFLTEKAQEFLAYLKEKEYLTQKHDGRFEWLKSARLYGYFVDQCSEYLSMRPSNGRIPWKRFESLFLNHQQLLKGARQGVDDYSNRDLAKPEGYILICEYCDSQY